jgi:hypothetical protein
MNVSGDYLGVSAGGGGGKESIPGAERIEVCYICPYEDHIVKPTKHCLKKGEGGEGNGNILKEMNLFKVHCMELPQ